MKRIICIISLLLAVCMINGCTVANTGDTGGISTDVSEEDDKLLKSTVIPAPLGEKKQFSNEKIAHSYGVAKNGEANDISKNAQKFFEDKGFNAFCLDTVSKEKVLYLTFDCGYENGFTSKILDVLKEKNVNAAFFCTLPQVKENPELIKRMIDEGHVVGNHSTTHPSFAEITREKMITEIKTMDDYLQEKYNYSEPYFRFPKGEYSENALDLVNSLGYSAVFWSLAYADWDVDNQKGEDYAFNTVTARLHPGAVILLHSVSSDNANALSRIIDFARQEGYEFRSLREYKN